MCFSTEAGPRSKITLSHCAAYLSSSSGEVSIVADRDPLPRSRLYGSINGVQDPHSVQHCAKLNSTNPLERPNGEIKRRSEVVGIVSNRAAVTRVIEARSV